MIEQVVIDRIVDNVKKDLVKNKAVKVEYTRRIGFKKDYDEAGKRVCTPTGGVTITIEINGGAE